MTEAIGAIVLLAGMALVFAMQIAIALYAFAGSPKKGLLCFFVPFYIYVHARRSHVGIRLLTLWYLGLAAIAFGGAMAS